MHTYRHIIDNKVSFARLSKVLLIEKQKIGFKRFANNYFKDK